MHNTTVASNRPLAYLPTYQNQNVGHQAKTICMYTIDKQEISEIIGFQRLSSSREELSISKLHAEENGVKLFSVVFREEFAITIISKMWDCPTFLIWKSQDVPSPTKCGTVGRSAFAHIP